MPPRAAATQRKLKPEASHTVLLVDDDRVMLGILEEMITQMGYAVTLAENGEQALARLSAKGPLPDIVLLDREMPDINGMEIIRQMKKDKALKRIPVIMQTAMDKPSQMQEGIDAGVFYYLTKPVRQQVLTSVMQAALREIGQRQTLQQEMQRQKGGLDLLDTGKFRYQTPAEAENLACLLAAIFPDPERVLPGLAELLLNAVEHGNLNVGYERKTELLSSGTWHQEIERLLGLPQNQPKQAEVIFKRKPDGLYIQITDEGDGFDWKRYLQIDPARASDNHGRGIAQANMLSFDRMRYNPKGNQLLGVVYTKPGDSTELAW